MISLTKISDTRLNLEVTGTVISRDVAHALAEFEAKTDGMENGVLLYQLHDFKLPSVSTMATKLVDLPRWFKMMRCIRKIALIADKRWIRKVAEFEGYLIPGLRIRSFTAGQGAVAEAWLAQEN